MHLLVVIFGQKVSDVALDRRIEGPAVAVPKHHPGRFFLKMKKVKGFSDAPMIPFFGFCQLSEIGVERLLVRPGGPIDSLQHFIAGITTPVGSSELRQLKGF